MKTLKEVIENLLEENYQLEKENKQLKQRISKLVDENEKIKKFFPYDELELLDEIKQLEKQNKKLHQQIEGLHSENFELENWLFTQQLNEDETYDYIEKLKSECDYWQEEFHQVIDENDKQIEYINSLKNELFQIYINKRY